MESLKNGLLILAAVALATIAGAFLGWHVRQHGDMPANTGSLIQSTTLAERSAEGGMLRTT